MIFKAILVIFVVSDTIPPSMMLGEFSRTFLSEADCQGFLAARRDKIKQKVEAITAEHAPSFQIIGHRASCVRDTSGQPT